MLVAEEKVDFLCLLLRISAKWGADIIYECYSLDIRHKTN